MTRISTIDKTTRDIAFSVGLFANSAFGGMTIIGIPISLSAAGIDKFQIAVFYTVNAFIAVVYNVYLMPRLRRWGYPKAALVVTSAFVPLGYAASILGAVTPVMLYAGGAAMMFVSTLVPQVLGRKQAESPGTAPDKTVGNLRRILIVGYVTGLAAYSVIVELSFPVVASTVVTGLVCTLSFLIRRNRQVHATEGDPTSSKQRPRLTKVSMLLIVCALCAVALLKGVNSFRGIYVPIISAEIGLSPGLVSASTLAASLAELIVLPLLTWASLRWGSPLALGAASFVGAVAFVVFFSLTGPGSLFAAQLLYAVVSAGFQSTGLVLLAKLVPGGLGPGASAYMAVMQLGSITGILLPLLIDGYSASIFLIAVALCLVAMILCIAIYIIGGREPRQEEGSSQTSDA